MLLAVPVVMNNVQNSLHSLLCFLAMVEGFIWNSMEIFLTFPCKCLVGFAVFSVFLPFYFYFFPQNVGWHL